MSFSAVFFVLRQNIYYRFQLHITIFLRIRVPLTSFDSYCIISPVSVFRCSFQSIEILIFWNEKIVCVVVLPHTLSFNVNFFCVFAVFGLSNRCFCNLTFKKLPNKKQNKKKEEIIKKNYWKHDFDQFQRWIGWKHQKFEQVSSNRQIVDKIYYFP